MTETLTHFIGGKQISAPGALEMNEKDEARNAASWYRRIVAESFGLIRGGDRV